MTRRLLDIVPVYSMFGFISWVIRQARRGTVTDRMEGHGLSEAIRPRRPYLIITKLVILVKESHVRA